MRDALFFSIDLKKSASELHRMLAKAYIDSALSGTTCRDWFCRLKNENSNLCDKHSENRSKRVKDHQ